jgi:hypothetical protein
MYTYVVEPLTLIFTCVIFSKAVFIFSGPKIGPYGQCIVISDTLFLNRVSDLEFLIMTLSIPRMFVSEKKMVQVT